MEEQSDDIKDNIPEHKLEDCKFLFLDASSSCTGYAIAKVDFINKKSEIIKAGAIWFDPKWEHAQKYDYMYGVIQTYFEVAEQIDFIVMEQYSVNPSKGVGIMVSPELAGVIKAAAWSNNVKVRSYVPQSWRKDCGIKPAFVNGKKDFKAPAKAFVEGFVKLPEELVSNVTGKPRQAPSDIYDAICLGYGWLKRQELSPDIKDIDVSQNIKDYL